ncbi:hypothetical protein [Halosolutus gelatinilyticus]|uniref:hypothetical protein n=1 Tax=Halosolutus gelatinilyticus TaxID=2931975 RepID=UPI001FF6F137|nr:hypothetical protein [Halosolutus gelatinilyticus]
MVVLAIGAAVLPVPVAADHALAVVEGPDDFGFESAPDPVEVEPPQTAEIRVTNTGGDPFTFELSPLGDHLHFEAEIEPEADDVTILIDTGNVGADEPKSLGADGSDRKSPLRRNASANDASIRMGPNANCAAERRPIATNERSAHRSASADSRRSRRYR